MNIRMVPDRVLSTILSSPAGPTIKTMVEILERRPGYGLHLIGGAPRDDDQRGRRVALAIVLVDQESRLWGLSVAEMDDPQVVRAVCAVGAVDVASADACMVIKSALTTLTDDPMGKSYDFSIDDDDDGS